MKRSEMVDKLSKLLLSYCSSEYTYYDDREASAKKDADEILYDLEKLGMLPPLANLPNYPGKIQNVNEWEPESE